jgi:hypothetical protein
MTENKTLDRWYFRKTAMSDPFLLLGHVWYADSVCFPWGWRIGKYVINIKMLTCVCLSLMRIKGYQFHGLLAGQLSTAFL